MIRSRALTAGHADSNNNNDGEFPNGHDCHDCDNKDEDDVHAAGGPGGHTEASRVVVINDGVTIIVGCWRDRIGTTGGRSHMMGRTMREDDVEVGVPLTTTMMMLAATTMTGGAAEMPGGVWDKFEALPERDGAEFPPLELRRPPLLGCVIGHAIW
jgi:hypothetical protein